jgi:hypothetical protein
MSRIRLLFLLLLGLLLVYLTSSNLAELDEAVVFPDGIAILPVRSADVFTQMAGRIHPTLADLWAGRARFVVDAQETGLPMGESETLVMPNGEFYSYLHASDQTIGVKDRCGDPVPFPGCTVIYRSYDEGRTFKPEEQPRCQFECRQCPCQVEVDHTNQQQYPRVFFDEQNFWLVYEYKGSVMLRHSRDGLTWAGAERIDHSGHWNHLFRYCHPTERIGEHPFTHHEFKCLAGGPPGIYVDGDQIYVFLAIGQNPGAMGCYTARAGTAGVDFRRCQHNPLFAGSDSYGPLNETGPLTNPHFDFRTISSAEVEKIGLGDMVRYYMLFEGVRGPGPGDPGDSQFGLGLARSMTNRIDGPWEKFPGNPILADLPGNIGLGHADLVINDGRTFLYTSLDGIRRSRLILVWETG